MLPFATSSAIRSGMTGAAVGDDSVGGTADIAAANCQHASWGTSAQNSNRAFVATIEPKDLGRPVQAQ